MIPESSEALIARMALLVTTAQALHRLALDPWTPADLRNTCRLLATELELARSELARRMEPFSRDEHG